jgi:hypothetical protein
MDCLAANAVGCHPHTRPTQKLLSRNGPVQVSSHILTVSLPRNARRVQRLVVKAEADNSDKLNTQLVCSRFPRQSEIKISVQS